MQRFRSLRGTAVELDNPTFLVGRNGSGKSNVVEALAVLADAMTTPLAAVIDRRGGIGAVGHRTSARGRVPDVGLRVDLADLPTAREAMYAFELRATRGYGYEVRREQCRCILDDGSPNWFDRDGSAFHSSIESRPALAPSALALPLVAGDERFAPVVQFLANIQPYRIQPATLRELQDSDAGTRLRGNGSNAASVLRRLDRETQRRLQEFLQVVVPGEVEVTAEPVQNKLTLKFAQQGAKGALTLDPHSMSDGTLRALGLLAAAFQPHLPTVLIIEEPEATIHPGALGAILDVLRHVVRSTQAIVTTHSPDILEAPWIDDRHLRIVSWERGATRITPVSDATRTALHEHLMDAGDLLRANALLGAADNGGEQPQLFETRASLASCSPE